MPSSSSKRILSRSRFEVAARISATVELNSSTFGSRLPLFHLHRICQHAIYLRKHRIVQAQHLPALIVVAHEPELDLSQGGIQTSDDDYRDCAGLLQRCIASRAVVTTNHPIYPAVSRPAVLHKHSGPPVYAICACRKSVSACPDSVSGPLSDGFNKPCGCPIPKPSDRDTPPPQSGIPAFA